MPNTLYYGDNLGILRDCIDNESAAPAKIVVYQVTDTATTMRSARGSWFIGTLSKGDHFYHHFADSTREGQWVWGYTASSTQKRKNL